MSQHEDAWHLDDDLRARYLSGMLPEAAAWSVEAHAAQCPRCRAGFPVGDRLAALWDAVEDGVDRASRSPVERLLLRAGLPDQVARLLAATPSLTATWCAGLLAVLALALAASHLVGTPSSSLPFLIVAPLAPLAGVAIAFGPRVDPANEIGLAAPVRGMRIVLLRAVPTVAVAVVVAALLSPFLGAPGLGALGWLLPALAVAAAALALSSWWPPLAAATTVGTGWVTTVVVAEALAVAPGAAFGPAGQLTAVAVLVFGSLVVAARVDTFDRVSSR